MGACMVGGWVVGEWVWWRGSGGEDIWGCGMAVCSVGRWEIRGRKGKVFIVCTYVARSLYKSPICPHRYPSAATTIFRVPR